MRSELFLFKQYLDFLMKESPGTPKVAEIPKLGAKRPQVNVQGKTSNQRATQQCPQGQHQHPGIQDCHPIPPASGSWHRDPRVRHTIGAPGQSPFALRNNKAAESFNAMIEAGIFKFSGTQADGQTANHIKSIIGNIMLDDTLPQRIRSRAETVYRVVNRALEHEKGKIQEFWIREFVFPLLNSAYKAGYPDISDQFESSRPMMLMQPLQEHDVKNSEKYWRSELDAHNMEDHMDTRYRVAKMLYDSLQADEDFQLMANLVYDKYGSRAITEAIPLKADGEERALQATIAMSSIWQETTTDDLAAIYQKAAALEFGLEDANLNNLNSGMDSEFETKIMPGVRKYLRAQYNLTQNWFKERDIQHVLLYRSFMLPKDASFQLEGSGQIDLQSNPLSSFTANPGIAAHWDTYGMKRMKIRNIKNRKFAMISSWVPVENILSSAQTGMGGKAVQEMVVFPGSYDKNYITHDYGEGKISALWQDNNQR